MKRAYGFTIVELLIVIVVIAILAAISVVAYSNFTVRASDTRVREGAAQFEKALYLWPLNLLTLDHLGIQERLLQG